MVLSSLVGCLALWIGLQSSVPVSHAVSLEGWELVFSDEGQPQLYVNLKYPDLNPRTCKDVKSQEPRAIITLSDGYEVLCDTQTDGGGWIVIQRRLNQDVDFYRNWTDYKYGFGNISGNFWFGNERIHRLTFLRRYQLRVDLTFNSTEYYATYSHFRLFGESENYQLDVNGYSGNAGDSLGYQNGMAFSTPDRDNDMNSANCATQYHGAWWYRACHDSNLNGLWGSKKFGEGLSWLTTTGHGDTATFTEIKIRPVDCVRTDVLPLPLSCASHLSLPVFIFVVVFLSLFSPGYFPTV